MHGTPSPSIEQLLGHSRWVRDLARRLARDPDVAEDLVQATYVTAIERPPAAAGNSRNWLATVLRNLLSQHRRREGDRSRREARAARPEALPSTAAMLEKVQVQRQVAEAVLSLHEPYRSVVLWRFFEDMAPARIARRQGVPVATVHSRLQRALRILSVRLRGAGRDRKALASVLAPLAARSVGFPSGLIGFLFMKSKLIAVTGILVGAVLLTWAIRSPAAPAGPPITPPAPRSTAPIVSPDRAEVATDGGTVPARQRLADPGGPATDAPPEELLRFRGRVFDAQGRPVPGLQVGLAPGAVDEGAVAADADGVFELTLPPGAGQLHVLEEGWITLVAGIVPDASSATPIEPVIVTTRRIGIAGRVVDAAGAPVPEADIAVRVPSDFAARIPFSLDATAPLYRGWQSSTGEDGAFRIAGIGFVPGASVVARKADYRPTEVGLAPPLERELRLVLERPPVDHSLILGQVLDARGNPVARAQVTSGRSATVSGADGMFRLEREGLAGSRRLVALHRGHLPGATAIPEHSGGPPPFVFVHLGRTPLHIRGRVVSTDGRPVVGARVWPLETELAPGINGSVEGYLAGGPTDAELVERFTEDGRLLASLGDIKERNPSAAWAWVQTGSGGAFDLGGLQDREYTLRVFVEEGLQMVDSGPHRAGSTVEIRFEPEIHPVVAGRVVALDGTPVPGVTVELNRWATWAETELPDGSTWSTGDAVPGPSMRTDQQGRFRVERIGRGGLWFTVLGDDIMNQNFGLHERGYENLTRRSFDDLEIRVERRMHIRLELNEPDLANRFRILDASGEPLPIVNFDGGGRTSSGSWPVEDGRTRVHAVSERAAFVALLAGDREVRRSPITLRPGIVNVIRD